jgi:hypothetical protein
MVLLLISWVIANSYNIEKHENLMEQLIPQYRKSKVIKAYKYLGHWIGHDQSTGFGRLEIFEFENLADLDKFFEELGKNKKASKILQEKLKLINPATVRFSLLSDKRKDLWFQREKGAPKIRK